MRENSEGTVCALSCICIDSSHFQRTHKQLMRACNHFIYFAGEIFEKLNVFIQASSKRHAIFEQCQRHTLPKFISH